MTERFKERYPAAMECLEKDLEACLIYLQFPEEHRLRIRTTNGLERIIEELKRRTKVVGRLPSEPAALKLVLAVARNYERKWRGITVTAPQLAQIDQLVLPPHYGKNNPPLWRLDKLLDNGGRFVIDFLQGN